MAGLRQGLAQPREPAAQFCQPSARAAATTRPPAERTATNVGDVGGVYVSAVGVGLGSGDGVGRWRGGGAGRQAMAEVWSLL